MSHPPPPTTPLEAPRELPKTGDVIAGKYRVERVIGMGGMGVVVAARHIELDEPVAIKMLLPHVPATGEPVARFLREAKAAIKIKSEHVVRVLDVGRTATGSPYIVMEYLDGYDLAQVLERSGPLPVEDTVDYVLQACEAIAAAHALGIVHRDLKPANLFLTTSTDGAACVKVLDFGISKLAPSASGTASGTAPALTSTASVMGTPCFMSPEQLRSTRDVDARADIWSMGAILHALMTGMPPYDGESNADVSAKIIRDAPTPLRQLRADTPAELEAIVLRCLEKDPARRFADVALLAEALSKVTPRDSSKASATRVARIAAAVATTVLSIAPPEATADLQAGAGPTRTASAWGDTRREENRGRKIAGMIAAGGIVAGALVFGVMRWHGTAVPAVAAPPSAAASAPGTTIEAPPALPPIAPAPPSAASSAATAPSVAGSGSASAAKTVPARPPVVRPAASTAGSAPKGATPATPSAKPAEGSALFNGRD
jgi:hypothetical protein